MNDEKFRMDNTSKIKQNLTLLISLVIKKVVVSRALFVLHLVTNVVKVVEHLFQNRYFRVT